MVFVLEVGKVALHEGIVERVVVEGLVLELCLLFFVFILGEMDDLLFLNLHISFLNLVNLVL